jgi:small subunit ribosomal protein S11
MPKKRKTGVRRRERKQIAEGKAYIQSTFNNTVITLTDQKGNVIAWWSSGPIGGAGGCSES